MITVTLGGAQLRLCDLLLAQSGGSSPQKRTSSSLLCVTKNLTMLCAGTFGHVSCEKAAFVARRPFELPRSASCAKCAAIIDSANRPLREAVAKRRLPALTCGLSGTDTFTFSSWRQDGAMLSLSRSITAFDDTIVEPFELPVSFSKQPDPFELLAAAAVLCLLGAQNPLPSMKLWQVNKDKS